MEFRVLGTIEAWNEGQPLPVRGAVQRSVLALLLLHPNEVVRVEELIDELWGGTPPETAPKMIQNAVSGLRKALVAPDILLTRPGGYLLALEPEQQLDARRFERLVEQAREALAHDDPARSLDLLEQAEALWRGPPFAEASHESFSQPEIARLEDLHLAAIECRIEASLALGRHAELVGELEGLIARHPLRETLRMQLMVALYRSGRQAEALAAYREARRFLSEEIGIEPSPALQRVERAILLQDPELDAPPLAAPSAPAASPGRVARKTLSVLYSQLDVHGRRLDPEAYSRLIALAEESISEPVERFGGRVQSAPGGAIVGVFGVPSVGEDDALRAVLAAASLADVLPELNRELEGEWGASISIRTGVVTGETLVDDPGGSAAAVAGNLLDVAVRLAQAAPQDAILVTAGTERTVRAAARTEAAGDVRLAGEPEPVFRLLDVTALETPMVRRHEGPLIGRDWELGQLGQAFERAVRGRTSYLLTVLGPAGMGKSRLAEEFVRSTRTRATVLGGRCVSYGAGVTFWPLSEIVRGAAGESSREAILGLVAGDPDAEQIADRIAGAIGVGEPAGTAPELFWAARKLFTALAREQPLVLVLEDIHWAEPTLLDLLDHVVETTRDVPVLVLCLARPELLDDRPSWGGGKVNASAILLEPLSQDESELVIDNAGGGELPEETSVRITEAAEGNPLFLEQMVAMALEAPTDAGVTVPPNIQALLAARLDRLPAEERSVLERAAVVGREFWRGAVLELSPPDAQTVVMPMLETLSRRELIGSAASPVPRDEGYRFRHALIREAAYEGIPKRDRADLHERFALYLERTPEHPARDYEEILGYHLEQAHVYRSELGAPDAYSRALARRAAELLGGAGRRAYDRGDVPAAVALLTRAGDLLDPGDPARIELLPDLGEAFRESGDFPKSELLLAEAIDAASAADDRALLAYARLVQLRMRLQIDPELSADQMLEEAAHAITAFTEVGDERRLGKAWELLAWSRWIRCHAAATEDALRRSIAHARRAGDGRTEAQSLHLLLGATLYGPVHVSEGIARCEEILAHPSRQKRVMASALRALAALKAMSGEFDEARELLQRFTTIVADLGLRVTAASAAETYGVVELLAGDPLAAERELRLGYARLEEMGETSTSSNLAALLAQALHAQGRDEEAVLVTEPLPAADDVSARVHRGSARAKALAWVGRIEEAEEMGRDAVALAAATDFLVMWGDALSDLAEVLQHAVRPGEATPLVTQALRLYEQKGNTVAAGRAQQLLAELRLAATGTSP